MRAFLGLGVAAAALVFAGSATAQQPYAQDVLVVPPAKTMSCDEAAQKMPNVYSLPAEEMVSTAARFNECVAQKYNEEQARRGSNQRILAASHVTGSGPNVRIFFTLISLSPQDLVTMRYICAGAATAMGAPVTADPLLIKVVTAANDYSCGAYIDAALRGSPTLYVVPTYVPGMKVSRDLLERAGVSKGDLDNVESVIVQTAGSVHDFMTSTAISSAIGLGGVPGSVEVSGKCAKIFGKEVCL